MGARRLNGRPPGDFLESGKTLNELGGSAQLFATANTFARRRHDWQEESRF
jgi:hypothetical protein